MNYYIDALKKYAVFSGRTSRKAFWYFFLFNLLISIALGLTEGLLGIAPESSESVLGSIYNLFIFIPNLTIGVRRMHDVNKSGWFIIIPIYNLVLALMEGTEGDNNYGRDPYRQQPKEYL